jgi:hypothetical protein
VKGGTNSINTGLEIECITRITEFAVKREIKMDENDDLGTTVKVKAVVV